MRPQLVDLYLPELLPNDPARLQASSSSGKILYRGQLNPRPTALTQGLTSTSEEDSFDQRQSHNVSLDGLEPSVFNPSHHRQRQDFLRFYPVDSHKSMDSMKRDSEREETQ